MNTFLTRSCGSIFFCSINKCEEEKQNVLSSKTNMECTEWARWVLRLQMHSLFVNQLSTYLGVLDLLLKRAEAHS
jgi:hypothetical protein